MCEGLNVKMRRCSQLTFHFGDLIYRKNVGRKLILFATGIDWMVKSECSQQNKGVWMQMVTSAER